MTPQGGEVNDGHGGHDGADLGRPHAVAHSGLRISWTLAGAGWAVCTLEDHRAGIELVASRIGRTPEELLTAVARITAGAAEERVRFEAEPTVHQWVVRREGEEARIRVLELRDGRERGGDGRETEIWSGRAGVERLARAVIRCFDEAARANGEDGYLDAWGEAFPRTELEALRRLWRARNPQHAGDRRRVRRSPWR
ncbi:hypothetical protein ACIA8O_34390 [Kitasatospora sp. NPDC051853]|uniref:hypothetical protein n=1 Tax=Kitasatospora sp. NPDC051853 TaxID=3364058 RepID=UPI0037BDE570